MVMCGAIESFILDEIVVCDSIGTGRLEEFQFSFSNKVISHSIFTKSRSSFLFRTKEFVHEDDVISQHVIAFMTD
jgi:hypothetical protein